MMKYLHAFQTLSFQEILTLGISTLYWEEEALTALHAIGMVICVSGISLHVLLKAIDTRRKS